MCGIVGVVAASGAVDAALAGLARLEYRGYDSSGISFVAGDRLLLEKAVGGVANLHPAFDGSEGVALGHTRWATHGAVTRENAHPHTDCAGRIAVVHNGIIENHRELREGLLARGHRFRSETDTEVLPHLLEEHAEGSLHSALQAVLPQLRGSYSIAALRLGEETIAFAKNRTPLLVGTGNGCRMLASDPNALAGIAETVTYLEDGDHGWIRRDAFEVRDRSGRTRTLRPVAIDWSAEDSEKAGFAHYMLKEIHETPQVINRVLSGRVFYGPPYVRLDLDEALLRDVRQIKLIGAGTSHHACLLGASYLRELAGIPATAELATEYKDAGRSEAGGTLVVAVSQSGETLDTLEALRPVEEHGHPILAVTNNPHSALGRRADAVLPLNAGPEVSVAATKTFLAQVVALILLALRMARIRGRLGDAELAWFAHRLKELPRLFARTLQSTEALETAGAFLAKFGHSFVLGKGLNLHAAQEGALKLKEIAYQHAEAYSAGELKHGPFALLTTETPVVVLVPENGASEKILSNVAEVRARGSPLVLLTTGDVAAAPGLATHLVRLPAVPELFQPLVFANALHLLAYETAKRRGCEIDRPRNLAKSVTVE